MPVFSVWRITSRSYGDVAFSGEGAKKHGNRFNSVGNRVVYTSGSLSLAILEILVRINDRRRMRDYVCIPATIDDHLVRRLEADDLSDGWDNRPYSSVSQQIGDTWIATGESAVLQIPSVVVPLEHNYLLNPAHPDYSEIRIGEAIDLPFDPRLLE